MHDWWRVHICTDKVCEQDCVYHRNCFAFLDMEWRASHSTRVQGTDVFVINSVCVIKTNLDQVSWNIKLGRYLIVTHIKFKSHVIKGEKYFFN